MYIHTYLHTYVPYKSDTSYGARSGLADAMESVYSVSAKLQQVARVTDRVAIELWSTPKIGRRR